MKINWKFVFMQIIKWSIHIPALLLSLIMVIDTLSGISIQPFWRNFFIGCAVYVELFGQFARGLAAAYRRNKKYVQAVFCWLLVGVYIGAFAGVSAVGVFMTKVSEEEHRIEFNQDNREIIKGKYDSTKIELDNKINEQNIEYVKNKGKGAKYDALGEDIKKLKEDLANYENQLTDANTVIQNTHVSIFTGLPNPIKIAFFSVIMFVIYTGLLLTPWPINLEILHNVFVKTENETDSETDNLNVTGKGNSKNLDNGNVTNDGERICPVCGIRFKPKRSDQIYHNDRCRLAAFRAKNNGELQEVK